MNCVRQAGLDFFHGVLYIISMGEYKVPKGSPDNACNSAKEASIFDHRGYLLSLPGSANDCVGVA